MKRAVIYGCFDNFGKLRYGGQAFRENPSDRWFEHLKGAEKGSKLKIAEELRDLAPEMSVEFRIITEFVPSGHEAQDLKLLDDLEIKTIADGRARKECDWNVAPGGKSKGWQTKEARERNRISIKRSAKEVANRPEVKAQRARVQKITNARAEIKAKRSAGQLIAQNRPEVKAKKSNAISLAKNIPERRMHYSAIATNLWKDENFRAKNIAAITAARNTLESRKKSSERTTEQWKRQHLRKLIRKFNRTEWMHLVLGKENHE